MSQHHENRICNKHKNLPKRQQSIQNNTIIGDFNIDINSNEVIDQEFLQILLEKGYHPGFTETTRPATSDCTKGTCIDNFYIKLNKIKHKTYTLTIPFNDHYPIFMSMREIKKSIPYNSNKYINYQKLKNFANTECWSEITSIEDPNIALDKLILKIKNCINKAETTRDKNKQKNMTPRKNWISSAIMTSCAKKGKLQNLEE